MLSFLVVSTICCSWYCISAGIADATSLGSRAILSKYKFEERIPSPIVWLNIQEDLVGAIQLAPEASQYYEDQAYLYAVRGAAVLGFPEIADPILNQAAINYRLGLSKRPMDAASSANLALVLHYLKQDVSADLFLGNAMQFASNDPAALTTIFFLASQLQDHLPNERKGQLEATLINAKEPLKSRLKVLYSTRVKNEF